MAAGMLGLAALPDQSLAAPARPGASVEISDFAVAWAHRQGWIGEGVIEALRRQWGAFDRIPDVPRVLADSGLISPDQRRELQEVVSLSRELPSVRLRRRLGSGAVGGVYLARSVDEDQQVAVKVLHREIADQEEPRARFEREISTLSRLDHPGIPKLYGHDCDARVPFLIMEFVPGVTLGELLREAGALPETYVLWAAIQVAQTLEYAWRRGGGLVHRDIKPDNLIVQLPEGTTAENLFTSRHPLKIVDFGLARPQQAETSLTMTGMVVGTPRYMAPEQVRGESLDWRADLYALGATCYHLLTGQVPFPGSCTADVMMAHLSAPVPDPGQVVPALTRRSCGIVMRAMAKERESRFPDYRSFIHACEQALAALDTRPMVLLRKPFTLPATETTRRLRTDDPRQGRQGDPLFEQQDQPSRSSVVRGRVQERFRQQQGTERVAVRNGSAGAAGGDAPTLVQRHDEVFGGAESARRGRGATDALRRVLLARARGEATELDLDDLEDRTRRLRSKTADLIECSVSARGSLMPGLLLVAAALLCAAGLLLRLL